MENCLGAKRLGCACQRHIYSDFYTVPKLFLQSNDLVKTAQEIVFGYVSEPNRALLIMRCKVCPLILLTQ